MDPKVSFITGVKNRSKELRETIQSFIDQDINEWEAIIVDDHSEEDIKGVVESFQDSRLHYFLLPENLTGISNGRNFAVKNAKAEILLVADADDINHLDRARVTHELMTKNNYDVFYTALINYSPEKNIRTPRKYQPFNEKLFKMFNFITNPSAAYRKEIFEQVGGYDPEFVISEDYDLFMRMLRDGAKFGSSSEPLVDYRISSKSLSHEKFQLMHDLVMKVRTKNNIPPFDVSEIKKYAVPEIAEDALSENGVRLWKDDRFQ